MILLQIIIDFFYKAKKNIVIDEMIGEKAAKTISYQNNIGFEKKYIWEDIIIHR